jgi:hypothetical protein
MALSDRHALLLERLAAVEEGAVIRPPFHYNYGFNIRLGTRVFLNFTCVILDVAEVTIGDLTQIGRGVQIPAADHPRDPALRASGLEFGRPIRIRCSGLWSRATCRLARPPLAIQHASGLSLSADSAPAAAVLRRERLVLH